VRLGLERLGARPLDLVRMGLCVVALLRQEDFLRGLVAFEHHEWGPGPEFGPQSLARATPSFAAPLLPGLDVLLAWSGPLCRLRLALTVLLLIGVLPRINALLLAVVSFGLFAADGFRYLHHLLILYVGLLLLALDHTDGSTAGDGRALRVPFALLALRAHVLVVYLAAGLAKLSPAWLSGRTLTALADTGFISGPWLDASLRSGGASALAIGACITELLIPLLLVFRRTRVAGIALAVLLHVTIHETMLVSTFGGTMLVLLLSFLPCAAERGSAAERAAHPGPLPVPTRSALLALAVAAASPLVAYALGTGVGSYSMFTRLVRYELSIDVDGHPFPREALAAHLGRDGARIVRLASGAGIGETNVQLLRQALPRLASFVCRLEPGARRVSLELETERIEGGEKRAVAQRAVCPDAS
jgi:hypothetical protein